MSIEPLFPLHYIAFVADRQWMDRRRDLQLRLKSMLGHCGNLLREDWEKVSLQVPGRAEARVSQGENYHGYPWLVLDFPRNYGKTEIVAQRFFVLWGHALYFSWHIKGEALHDFRAKFMSRQEEFSQADFYLFTGNDEWEQQLDSEQYQALKDYNGGSSPDQSEVFKAGIRLPLSALNDFQARARDFDRIFRELLLPSISAATEEHA